MKKLLILFLFSWFIASCGRHTAESEAIPVPIEPVVVEEVELLPDWEGVDSDENVAGSSQNAGQTSADKSAYSADETGAASSASDYLLGFDDDVDDVHDMELYMEDY